MAGALNIHFPIYTFSSGFVFIFSIKTHSSGTFVPSGASGIICLPFPCSCSETAVHRLSFQEDNWHDSHSYHTSHTIHVASYSVPLWDQRYINESGADIHLLLHQFSSCRRIYFAGLLWRSDQIIDTFVALNSSRKAESIRQTHGRQFQNNLEFIFWK